MGKTYVFVMHCFFNLYGTFLPIYIPTPLPQNLHTSRNILEKLMVDGKEILPLFLQPFLYWIKSMKSKVFVPFTQIFLTLTLTLFTRIA